MPIEVAVLKGHEECVKLLFPGTTPLPEYADWSIDGIIQHGKNVSATAKTYIICFSLYQITVGLMLVADVYISFERLCCHYNALCTVSTSLVHMI
jgi:hypothetical protein